MTRELTDAYDTCLRLARSHYENFPVASSLLPAKLRPHIAAIYAFARIADDFADEPGRSEEERLRLLDEWETLLRVPATGNRHRASNTVVSTTGPIPDADSMSVASAGSRIPDADSVFAALHDTISRFELPVALLSDLLSAFRQDVKINRYGTWTDLLDYCGRSANPVGRLVLLVFGYRRDELDVTHRVLRHG